MKKISLHIAFWIVYFLVCYISDIILSPEMTLTLEALFFSTQNLMLFYGFLFCINKFSRKDRKQTTLSILRVLVFLTMFLSLRYFVRYYFLPTYFDPLHGTLSIVKWWTGAILWILNYLFFAGGYFYFQSSIQKQKDLSKTQEEKANAEQKQLLAEQEKLAFENAQLRAQINPHFLFNTLGFLYSEAKRSDVKLADGIMALTDIMRTSIRKPDADGTVPLWEEIESITQLIKIYRLRYANQIHVSYTEQGEFEELTIVPHILLTLVENAFKHGDIHKAAFPLTINVAVTDDQLHFTVNNLKRSGIKEQSHGIGVHYLKRQMEIAYGDKFTFQVQDEALFYTTTLSIATALLTPESRLLNTIA